MYMNVCMACLGIAFERLQNTFYDTSLRMYHARACVYIIYLYTYTCMYVCMHIYICISLSIYIYI